MQPEPQPLPEQPVAAPRAITPDRHWLPAAYGLAAALVAPFFLDCRTAGRLLRVRHTVAWRWLRLLVRDHLLECVTVGKRQRASEYRYLGD